MPLVLSKKAVIAVIQVNEEVGCQRWQKCILPGCRHGGEAALGLNGPGPIGAPQKNAAMHGETRPTSGGGHGAAPQPALPDASMSPRLGKMMRAGVNPGQITKLRM